MKTFIKIKNHTIAASSIADLEVNDNVILVHYKADIYDPLEIKCTNKEEANKLYETASKDLTNSD